MLIHKHRLESHLGRDVTYHLVKKCHLCGQRIKPKSLTFDHVVPKSKGGKSGLNLLPAHGWCNMRRGNNELTSKQRLRARYHQLFLIAYALTEIK